MRALRVSAVLGVVVLASACTFRPIHVRDGSVDANDARSDADDVARDAVDALDTIDAPQDTCTRERCGPPANDERAGAVVLFDAPRPPAPDVMATDAADVDFDAPDVTSDAPRADAVDVIEEQTMVMPTASSHLEVPFDTLDATHSIRLCDSSNGPDVWFRFTIATRELVYADTHTATWPTMLAFTDENGALLNLTLARACDANTACPGQPGSQIVAALEAGTYYIVAAGIGTATGSATLFVRHVATGTGTLTPVDPGETMRLMGHYPSGASVNATCEHAGGGEDTYWWTSCPGAPAQRLSAHGCALDWSVPNVVYTDGLTGLYCATGPSDCFANWGSILTTPTSPNAGLHVLYIGGWGTGATGHQYAIDLTRAAQ